MATFLMFGKYSPEALKKISPERTEKAVNLCRKFGGEITSVYAMLGEHDLVIITEMPGVEQAMQASLALTKMSGISFATSPAVKVEEFDKLISET